MAITQYFKYLLKYHKDLSRAFNNDRFTAFRTHVEQLAQLRNSDIGKLNFHVSPNEFADWTDEELRALNQGFHDGEKWDVSDGQFSSIPVANRLTRRRTEGDDDVLESLNWDSADNPLGHPVYATTRGDGSLCRVESPVINQGFCGSCWAFVASGAVAASVMINEGVGVRLSAQELLDCDTSYNRGCSGGSPALALAYVMQSGASSALSYPYIGAVSANYHSLFVVPTAVALIFILNIQYSIFVCVFVDFNCLVSRRYPQSYSHCGRRTPVVGISSVVRITPYNPVLIETFLVDSGPVSVGVCGADLTFLFYAGGVFDLDACCTKQTHAMLLVGFGTDAEGGAYWVLRNSWGTSW